MKEYGFKILKTATLILLPLLFCLSCVEEYWPELDSIDEKLLVVEGFINNDPGPYIIKLSTTRSIDSIPNSTSSKYDFNAFTNAIVTIIDDQGNIETLEETEPGIYITSENGMQGIVGRMYKASIISPNGEIYESEFTEILPTVEVESVSSQEAENEDAIPGLQFYVSTETAADNDNFYLWRLEETHEYNAVYKYSHFFNGTFANREFNLFGQLKNPGSVSQAPPHNLMEIDYPEELYTCWQTNNITNNYINTTEFTTSTKIDRMPLNFVPFGDERLRVKYSLLVKQHRISKDAYTFLKVVDEQNSFDEFDLYTKQPYQIRGNIQNINNPDEPVLGFFIVSSISQKRIFTPPDEYPISDQIFSTTNCRLLTVRWDEYENAINFTYSHLEEITPEWQWPDDPAFFPWLIGDDQLFFSLVWVKHPTTDPITYTLEFAAISHYCSDCRNKGGVNQKPDFWED